MGKAKILINDTDSVVSFSTAHTDRVVSHALATRPCVVSYRVRELDHYQHSSFRLRELDDCQHSEV